MNRGEFFGTPKSKGAKDQWCYCWKQTSRFKVTKRNKEITQLLYS